MSLKQFYVNYKMAPEYDVKKDPADTSLKEDVSIDTTFELCYLILVRHSF